MENIDPADHLRLAERGAAAPWVRFPPTPWWYPPATAIWTTLGYLVVMLRDRLGAWALLPVVALVAVELGFVWWYRRYRGSMPSQPPPREFRPAVARLVLGIAALVVATIAVQSVAGLVPAAGGVAVGAWALLAWYERAYRAAARATTERLGAR